ncbi:MAG TPA: hypothetical protein VIU61_20670 [Kofleriaceae bacterium]
MTKSKPASATSPATGDAPDPIATATDANDAEAPKESDEADQPDDKAADKVDDKPEKPKRRKSGGTVEIELEVSRQRAAGWVVFGIILGSLLIWKLGTVGVWVGVALVIVGLYRAWQLVQTFLHPPGTITVTDREVSLPRGLCLPRPHKVPPAAVTAVYFLRKSVPWSRAAPVLVVELGSKALLYPRDWFASEADQRHVIHALIAAGGKDAAPPAEAAAET